MQRGPSSASPPFVTRRSTFGFSAVFVLTALGYQGLASDVSSSGGVLTATTLALAVVTGAVAWSAGLVLAIRARSLLWVLIAVVPLVPITSVMCAMFCPAKTAGKAQ